MNIESLNKIPERLKELEQHLDYTKTELAEKAGMSRSFYSNVATGAQLPSFDFLVKICSTFNVSTDWLIFGTGQMFREDNELMGDLEHAYIMLIKSILNMSQENRVKILKAIDAVIDLIPVNND